MLSIVSGINWLTYTGRNAIDWIEAIIQSNAIPAISHEESFLDLFKIFSSLITDATKPFILKTVLYYL